MTIHHFIKTKNLQNTLLIGYYGGGNYGDELLLEVLLNLFEQKKEKDISYYYTNDKFLELFHRQTHYTHVNPNTSKIKSLLHLFKVKNVIIGGGGIWGLDFNRNILFLSILLFILRFVFQKNIYLLGIGYYSSTTKMGHIAAWFAGVASNEIIARDSESLANFTRYNKHTSQDFDISFNLKVVKIEKYENYVDHIANELHVDISKEYILIAIRKFVGKHSNNYVELVRELIANNPHKNFYLCDFEPKELNPDGYKVIKEIEKNYSNVFAFDFRYNPVAFYFFLKEYKNNFTTIAPQFHSIIVSYLSGVSFFPLVYDNKTLELFKLIGQKKHYQIKELTISDLESFLR